VWSETVWCIPPWLRCRRYCGGISAACLASPPVAGLVLFRWLHPPDGLLREEEGELSEADTRGARCLVRCRESFVDLNFVPK